MKTLRIVTLVVITVLFSAFTMENNGYEIGDYATDFKLKNTDGKMLSLSDYDTAKGFIVTFTCNHCPYSKMYEDRIIELDKKFKGKGFPVIAINPNNPAVSPGDDFEGMQKRAKSKGFTFPYLFDDGQEIYPQYGATKTPHVFILNKDKKGLRVAYIGAIDDNARDVESVTVNYVEDAVNELLEGKEVSNTSTRAIGCSIKK
jgi:peroxiredoxin